jgi:hypothetical protein
MPKERRRWFYPKRTRWVRIAERSFLFVAALLATVTVAPQLLAWPYSTQIGHTKVYSEEPIPPELARVLARADALDARSPIAEPNLERSLFLTDGGWRWDLLSLTSHGAFALRRPFRDAIVVNACNILADRVENGAPVGGVRTLSGVIAHETTHIFVAHHLGEWRALLLPSWKNEGYADYVARESSLSDADYAQLHANGAERPAMFYYEARRRVGETLAHNGNNVDRLLRGN